VIAKPPSALSIVTAPSVSIDAAVIPSSPSTIDNSIEKHEACAAVTSSPELVAGRSSNRIAKPLGCALGAPDSVETGAVPSFDPPSRWADPLCSGMRVSS
jgi:hypothetical protein